MACADAVKSASRLHFSTPRNIEFSSRSNACTRRASNGDALPCANALLSRYTMPRLRLASVASNAPPTTASSTAHAAPAARLATHLHVLDSACGDDGGRRRDGFGILKMSASVGWWCCSCWVRVWTMRGDNKLNLIRPIH